MEERKDSKGQVLRKGETEQNDGRYQYDFQHLESWNTYYIYPALPKFYTYELDIKPSNALKYSVFICLRT